MAATGKCILVAGPPGVGKAKLIMRVVDKLRAASSNPNPKFQGFYTCEVREGEERVGFQVVTLDGRQGSLASTKTSSAETIRWPTVGRYEVDVASFESLALPELQANEDSDLFVIDEVGKTELFNQLFFPGAHSSLNPYSKTRSRYSRSCKVAESSRRTNFHFRLKQ